MPLGASAGGDGSVNPFLRYHPFLRRLARVLVEARLSLPQSAGLPRRASSRSSPASATPAESASSVTAFAEPRRAAKRRDAYTRAIGLLVVADQVQQGIDGGTFEDEAIGDPARSTDEALCRWRDVRLNVALSSCHGATGWYARPAEVLAADHWQLMQAGRRQQSFLVCAALRDRAFKRASRSPGALVWSARHDGSSPSAPTAASPCAL